MRFLWLGNATHSSHILVEMKNLPKPPYAVSFLGWNTNGIHRDTEKKKEYISCGAQVVKATTSDLEPRTFAQSQRQSQVAGRRGRQEEEAGGAGRRGRQEGEAGGGG